MALPHWPQPLRDLLIQQVIEPSIERDLQGSIDTLTPIGSAVSLNVRAQYEQNPYPRWVRAEPVQKLQSVTRLITGLFPRVSVNGSQFQESPDILVVGCGTGQQPIGTARRFLNARTLAVDLSLSSLAYAQRKASELGLNGIEFAQADLLQLRDLDRKFDVIEASGVLHHLEDPWLGWQVLLSLLRPNGVMRIGLYSRLARADITRIREYIDQQGYSSSAKEIRRCRRELKEMSEQDHVRRAIATGDYFSVSSCRDLFFHVQEHLFEITDIADFLRKQRLSFLGFEISPRVLNAYRQRFPDDLTGTNLENWQLFEEENTSIFLGMYQFWVQSYHEV